MTDRLRQALTDAASEAAAQEARRDLCACLGEGFRHLGKSLRLAGSMVGDQRVTGASPFGNGDDRLVSLGLLSETAAALVRGVPVLLQDHNLYAASALTRQLVEVEYLAWAFAEDQEEASNWLRSSREERLKRWQPRHLRERSGGRFRGGDYQQHCEFGGHPTPDGIRSLLPTASEATPELLLYEVARHGVSAWRYLLVAVVVNCLEADVDPAQLLPDEAAKAVGTAEAEWNAHERLGVIWQQLTQP